MSKEAPHAIRAYGDRKDDGRIQLSFTLPVPAGARAKELSADAVLVSQIMTQRDLHIENSSQLIELARKSGQRELLFLLGGPRIDHKLASELGFDAGFGPGTRPSQVASYIVDTLIKRANR